LRTLQYDLLRSGERVDPDALREALRGEIPCLRRELARPGGHLAQDPLGVQELAEGRSSARTGVELGPLGDALRASLPDQKIAKPARSARYSERQMHRLIADLYKRIGATNRQEALVLAARRGILD
jgi:hypothetical protein